MEDWRIVALYWARRPQAIACSEEKYGDYCLRVARNILGQLEDAQECVNDTWLSAWNSMPPHRPQALGAFFAKLTRRLAFNRWKRNTAQKRGGGQMPLVLEELSQCVAGSESVENTVEAKELGRRVERFLKTLPQRERDVFLRRYFFTEPLGDIGRRYGLTENHVAVLLSRVRKQLRALLEKEGYL